MRKVATCIPRAVRVLSPSVCTHSSWVPCSLALDLYEMCFNCRTKRYSQDGAHVLPVQAEQAPDKPSQGSLF